MDLIVRLLPEPVRLALALLCELLFLTAVVLVWFAWPTINQLIQFPRSLALKRTPEFLKYVDQAWSLIENDVTLAMGASMTIGLEVGTGKRAHDEELLA